jgi:hypothetical protein
VTIQLATPCAHQTDRGPQLRMSRPITRHAARKPRNTGAAGGSSARRLMHDDEKRTRSEVHPAPNDKRNVPSLRATLPAVSAGVNRLAWFWRCERLRAFFRPPRRRAGGDGERRARTSRRHCPTRGRARGRGVLERAAHRRDDRQQAHPGADPRTQPAEPSRGRAGPAGVTHGCEPCWDPTYKDPVDRVGRGLRCAWPPGVLRQRRDRVEHAHGVSAPAPLILGVPAPGMVPIYASPLNRCSGRPW